MNVFIQMIFPNIITYLGRYPYRFNKVYPRGYYFFFSGTYAGKIEFSLILGSPPLQHKLNSFLTIFLTPPIIIIIQIKITLFNFRFFIEDLTCCKVFSLNVFIDVTLNLK